MSECLANVFNVGRIAVVIVTYRRLGCTGGAGSIAAGSICVKGVTGRIIDHGVLITAYRAGGGLRSVGGAGHLAVGYVVTVGMSHRIDNLCIDMFRVKLTNSVSLSGCVTGSFLRYNPFAIVVVALAAGGKHHCTKSEQNDRYDERNKTLLDLHNCPPFMKSSSICIRIYNTTHYSLNILTH